MNIGIDIGGSHIGIGVVSPDGKILKKVEEKITYIEKNNIKEFLFSFFPFVYGIYPYAVVTDKQRQAMNEAGVDFVYMSIYDIAFAGAKRLLGV